MKERQRWGREVCKRRRRRPIRAGQMGTPRAAHGVTPSHSGRHPTIVSRSHEPSCRTPFRKNVGVPFTPLRDTAKEVVPDARP